MELYIHISKWRWTKNSMAQVLSLFAIICFSSGWSNEVRPVLGTTDLNAFVFNDNDDLDDDDDGILDTVEDGNDDGDNDHTTSPTDSDGDGVPNYLDIDSDNDGILDNVEGQTSAGFVAVSDRSSKVLGKDEAILIGCTPAVYLLVVPSDFGFPPNVLDGSLSATDVDLSSKWGLEPGSILVSVERGSTIPDGDRFFVKDGQNTIFRFTGSVDVIPRPGHSRRIQAMKRDGFLALDGTKYELISPLPTGVISANLGTDYYVENTTTSDIEKNSFLWQAKSEAESLLFYTTSVNINVIDLWLQPVTCLDTDGDGVIDEDEETDGTDPQDSCDFVLSSQSVVPSEEWQDLDCDGDGVTNQDEVNDNTDPLDSCDLILASQTISPSNEWNAIDCDNDGNPNGTDPNPLLATAVDDFASTPANVLLLINILENDDYLPNNAPNNLGIISLVQIGGNATGTISFDSDLGILSYTAPESEIDSDVTVIYQVCNVIPEPNVCATATVTINVTAGTLIALDDVASTPEDTAVEIDVLANDSGVPNTGTLTVTDPASGTVTVNDGGTPGDPSDDTVTYAPDPSFLGDDSFGYTLCDGSGNCDTATVTVQVGPTAPIDAVDDVASTPEDTAVDIDVLANDSGVPNTGTLTVTDPSSGTLTVNDGGTPNDPSDDTVTYAPDPSFLGDDSFGYTLCDGSGNCDTATVTVQVGPTVPIDAVDDEASTTEGVAVEIDVLANDSGVPDNGTLTVTDPASGTVTVNDGGTPGDPSDDTVTYAPDPSFIGDDSFDYTICDGADNCDTATVTVSVGPTPPVSPIDAVDDDFSDNPVNGLEGGDIAGSNVLDNDTLFDFPVDPADIILSSTPTGPLTVNEDGTVTVAPGTAAGTYTIEYTICYEEVDIPTRGAIYCDTATVTVVVEPAIIEAVNDDFSGNPIDGDTGGIVADANVLNNDTLNGTPLNPDDITLTSEPNGPLSINTDGTVEVASNTPEGTYSIDYTICENLNPGNCDSATVIVSVVPVPILVNQLVTPNGDGKNDFLFIKGVRSVPNNTLKIFNRWGVAVYEGEGYNNQNNIFDGRSKGRSTLSVEDYLPAGVYFYIFEYQKNQDNITDSGYLYLSK